MNRQLIKSIIVSHHYIGDAGHQAAVKLLDRYGFSHAMASQLASILGSGFQDHPIGTNLGLGGGIEFGCGRDFA